MNDAKGRMDERVVRVCVCVVPVSLVAADNGDNLHIANHKQTTTNEPVSYTHLTLPTIYSV